MLTLKPIGLMIAAAIVVSAPASAQDDKENLLPSELQQTVGAAKPLPPDWQKNIVVGQELDLVVYENAKVILRDNGVETVTVGGKVIRLLENTREIIEILKEM